MNNPQRSNKNGIKPIRPKTNENWIAEEVSTFPWENKNIVRTPDSFGFSYFRIIFTRTHGRQSKERKEKIFYNFLKICYISGWIGFLSTKMDWIVFYQMDREYIGLFNGSNSSKVDSWIISTPSIIIRLNFFPIHPFYHST